MLLANEEHNDSSVVFVGMMSPNVSSDSLIYVGTTQAKMEPGIENKNDGAVKAEANNNNNNDDAELLQILNPFLSMNLNPTPVQRKYIEIARLCSFVCCAGIINQSQ